jgi:signal transduction histidine kinase
MYRVTAKQLVMVQFYNANGTHKIVGTPGDIPLPSNVPSAVANSTKSRGVLRQNLIILNAGVIVLGIPSCYFLARRTLRPMEDVMENQARFSSDAAHELRTPVAALRVRNEVALRTTNLSLHQAKQIIQESADQAIRLERLSEALLQLSSERHTRTDEAIHLEDAANEAMNLHISPAQSKHISISDEVSNITVRASRQDVVQAISILLDNAIKYSPQGSKITMTSEQDQKWGLVHIIDEGRGIRATDIPRIFDRFYRANHARTTNDTSSYGLGLSIAHKLVTQNNGVLSVQSTLGEGSTFTIKLPLAKA